MLASFTDPSVPPGHTLMSMEEKTILDVLRECKYRYISGVLSRPYMEDISGYWLIHCKFTCIAQISLKHHFSI